jgi:hypothetical protein
MPSEPKHVGLRSNYPAAVFHYLVEVRVRFVEGRHWNKFVSVPVIIFFTVGVGTSRYHTYETLLVDRSRPPIRIISRIVYLVPILPDGCISPCLWLGNLSEFECRSSRPTKSTDTIDAERKMSVA